VSTTATLPSASTHGRPTTRSGLQVSEVALGSHVDAPLHFEGPDSEARSLEDFDVDDFRLEALQVDVTGASARERIGTDDLHRETPDLSPEIEMLVVHTGWDRKWGEETYFDHPCLRESLAELCVDDGFVLGVDFLSPDETGTAGEAFADPGFPAHERLLSKELLIFENLTGLGAFREQCYEFHGYPITLRATKGPLASTPPRSGVRGHLTARTHRTAPYSGTRLRSGTPTSDGCLCVRRGR